uniref:Tankyrase n=1 Tax=Pavo cristatus TaxID=9049 RepID=A0A8C9L9T5_PAVCR
MAAPPRRSQHHHHHHGPPPPSGPVSPPTAASPPRSPSLAPAELGPAAQRHSLAGPEGEAPPDAERPPAQECSEGAAPGPPPGSGSSSGSSASSSSSSSSTSSSVASSPAAESPEAAGPSGAFRELLEACRNGDVTRVKRLVDAGNVNAKDMAGRKSTPLHFAAGEPYNRGLGLGGL